MVDNQRNQPMDDYECKHRELRQFTAKINVGIGALRRLKFDAVAEQLRAYRDSRWTEYELEEQELECDSVCKSVLACLMLVPKSERGPIRRLIRRLAGDTSMLVYFGNSEPTIKAACEDVMLTWPVD